MGVLLSGQIKPHRYTMIRKVSCVPYSFNILHIRVVDEVTIIDMIMVWGRRLKRYIERKIFYLKSHRRTLNGNARN